MRRAPRPFKIYVDQDTDETVHVSFHPASRFYRDRMSTGQSTGATYKDNVIELSRASTRAGYCASLWHELGHYFIEREEFRISRKGVLVGVTEEDACDLFTWVPAILHDPRNEPLRQLMGVK